MANENDDNDDGMFDGLVVNDDLDKDQESVDDALDRLTGQGLDENDDIEIVDDDPKAKANAKTDDDEDDLQEIVFNDDGSVEGEDADPEDDEDFEKASTSVEKRIQRERRLKAEAREDAVHLSRAASEVVTKLRDAEISVITQRRDTAVMAQNLLQGRSDTAQEILAMMDEYGITEGREKYQDMIAEAKQGLRTTQQLINDAPSDEQLKSYQPDVPDAMTRQRTDAKTQDWVDNNSWFKDPKHRAKQQAAISISNDLTQSGMDPKSDRFFLELSRRVSQEVQGVEVHTHDGRVVRHSKGAANSKQRQRQTNRKRDVTGSQTRSAQAARKPTKGRLVLPAGGKQMMEALGLDFSNKEHVAEFMANQVDK